MAKRKVVTPTDDVTINVGTVTLVKNENNADLHKQWLETPEGKAYLAQVNEAKTIIQIGQRVWKKVKAPETGFVINLCTRIIKVNAQDDTVETEFLYAVTGPDKKMFQSIEDADGCNWHRNTRLTFAIALLKQHIAKETNNIWWEAVTK